MITRIILLESTKYRKQLAIENKNTGIRQILTKNGHSEAAYLKYILENDVIPQTFKVGKEGVVMEIRPLSAEVLYDGDNEPFRLG